MGQVRRDEQNQVTDKGQESPRASDLQVRNDKVWKVP